MYEAASDILYFVIFLPTIYMKCGIGVRQQKLNHSQAQTTISESNEIFTQNSNKSD